MGLKVYKYRGNTYQFDEGRVPVGAVLVEKAPVGEAKAAEKPTNKARRAPANKAKG